MALSKAKLKSKLIEKTDAIKKASDMPTAWSSAIDEYFADAKDSGSLLKLGARNKSLISSQLQTIVSMKSMPPNTMIFATKLDAGICAYISALVWVPASAVSGVSVAVPGILAPLLKTALDNNLKNNNDKDKAFDEIARVIHTYMLATPIITATMSNGTTVSEKFL